MNLYSFLFRSLSSSFGHHITVILRDKTKKIPTKYKIQITMIIIKIIIGSHVIINTAIVYERILLGLLFETKSACLCYYLIFEKVKKI